MTDRMRKALELIASGEGPQGGFLTRLSMIEIARESLAYVRPMTQGIYEQAKADMGEPFIADRVGGLEPLIVRDLLR